MKRVNYLIAILLVSVLLACNSQKKTQVAENYNMRCSYCDSLLGKGYFIDYPLRGIDKSTEGIPLIKNTENIKKDSFHVLTEFEVQDIRDNLFCFLGMKEVMVDQYFHPKFRRNEWPTESAERKIMGLYFNIGNYMKKNGSVYQPVDKAGEDTNFWLRGGGDFRIEYTKLNDDFIYTGTMQDSINLRDCINKEKKK